MSRPTIAVYAVAGALLVVSIVSSGSAGVAIPVAFLAMGVAAYIDYKHLRKLARTDEADFTERGRHGHIGE